MALSFEMTFLSMLLTSLYEPETKDEMRRCAFHPIEKRLMLGNEAIDYCADLSALISYYDLRDGWEDEKRVDKLAESALLKAAGQARGLRRFPAKGKRWSGMSPICTRLSRKTT